MKSASRIALISAMVILISAAVSPLPAGAALGSYSNYEKAIDLKIMGLFANTPDKFDLGSAPTRAQGAIMLVRLLGREQEAKQANYSHPFTDVPSWASPHVGYLYQNKLTYGIGNARFGSDDKLTAQQYITFVLRSLGYADNTDFTFDRALDKALETGLIGSAEAAAFKGSPSFIRNDLAGISYNALSQKLKASNVTLLDKLVLTDKAIFAPAPRTLGLYTSDIKADYEGIEAYNPTVTSYGSVAYNSRDLFLILRKALYLQESNLRIDVRSYNGTISSDFKPAIHKAAAVIAEVTGADNFYKSWDYVSDRQTLSLSVQYRFSKSEFTHRKTNYKSALDQARLIAASLVASDMSDYDKEKVLHDYIVNHTKYDYQNSLNGTLPIDSFDAYGCLVLNTAACEGYSTAMKLLCDLSGLECVKLTGKFRLNDVWQDHSWNIIKVGGKYYHLDVTNDDPVSNTGNDILAYTFFNLPDSEIAKTSSWEKTEYPACTSVESNYHVKNRLIVQNRAEFEESVREAVRLRKNPIELKVGDYTPSGYSDLTAFINGIDEIRACSYSIQKDFGIIRIYNIQYRP